MLMIADQDMTMGKSGERSVMADYAGTELEALAEARNYYRWIQREFQPFLGKRILEVGAGKGTFSSFILECQPQRLWLLEPTQRFISVLQRMFHSIPEVQVMPGSLERAQAVLKGEGLDTIVCVNVLEHIEDDGAALMIMRGLLEGDRGRLLLFVPALPFVYGSLDLAFGHVRRYRKADLLGKLARAGFEPVRCKYVNALGVLGWWYQGRILRNQTLSVSSVRWYDQYAIPLVATVERYVPFPFGQSLLVIADIV